jgi:hypothetical protein
MLGVMKREKSPLPQRNIVEVMKNFAAQFLPLLFI